MVVFKWRWYAGLLLCLTGLVFLAVGLWPADTKRQELTLKPEDMRLILPGTSAEFALEDPHNPTDVSPAILEIRKLALFIPSFIRPGEPARIGLEFRPDPEGNSGSGVGKFTDLLDTHYVAGESRLEFSGLVVDPPGKQSRLLAVGKTASFEWSVLAGEERNFEGTAWFYLRFIPIDGGPESEWPLAALKIDISSLSIAGLSVRQLLWLGGMAVLAGLLLSVGTYIGGLDRWQSSGTEVSVRKR